MASLNQTDVPRLAASDSGHMAAVGLGSVIRIVKADRQRFIAIDTDGNLSVSNDAVSDFTTVGKLIAISKQNPDASFTYLSRRWDTLVGETRTKAKQNDFDQASASVKAEEKSVEKLAVQLMEWSKFGMSKRPRQHKRLVA